MYRLFSRITKGLDPIADCFKEHVESEGMKLVKEVAEAVEAKKEKDAGRRPHRSNICISCVIQCITAGQATQLDAEFLLGIIYAACNLKLFCMPLNYARWWAWL